MAGHECVGMTVTFLHAQDPAAAKEENGDVDGDVDTTSAIEDDEEGAEELLAVHTANSEAFDQAMKERLKDQVGSCRPVLRPACSACHLMR